MTDPHTAEHDWDAHTVVWCCKGTRQHLAFRQLIEGAAKNEFYPMAGCESKLLHSTVCLRDQAHIAGSCKCVSVTSSDASLQDSAVTSLDESCKNSGQGQEDA